jgi:surface antigen
MQCGETLCCAKGEVCESNFFGSRNACVKKCDDGSDPCKGTCCKGDLVCTSDGCACPSGSVQRGLGKCVPPKEDPGDPRWNPIRDMLNMMGASSAAHGGSGSRSMLVRPAQSGSPAIDSALIAVAAVNGQAAAAALAFGEGKPDRAFRQKVRVARVRPPRVVEGPGLDAASAAALNKLLTAEARAYALAAASAKALWRARAAKAKGQRAHAKRQLRASSKFAGQAASALKRVPALRSAAASALTAGGVTEVTATEDQVTAFLATVKSGALLAPLRSALSALGVRSTDLKRLRAGLLTQTVTSGSGPALLEPLNDSAGARDLRLVTAQLSKYSKRARRHPIAR